MKKSTKIALILALCCIGLGTILVICSTRTTGGSLDLSVFGTVSTVTKEVEITEQFHTIHVEDVQCSISILPSDDAKCTVVCTDSDQYVHQIHVIDKTLKITAEKTGEPENPLLMLPPEMEVTIYLPATAIISLNLETISGNIEIPHGFTIRTGSLSSTSGNISFSGVVQEHLGIHAESGDISLENVDLSASLSASGTSGEISLKDVRIISEMQLETVSGNIELDHVNAVYAQIRSVSGNISCNALSEKHFITSTVSGNIQVTDSPDSYEIWEISTTSGNIVTSVSN